MFGLLGLIVLLVATFAPVTSELSTKGQSVLINVGLLLYQGFFVPGDYVLSILSTHAPRAAQFLGLHAVGHGSMLSGLISGVVWLGAIVLIIVVCRRLYKELQQTGRIVARRTAIAFRSHALKRQARLARTEVSEQGELTALELLVLRCHAKLAPGHLSTASAIASALKVRSSHALQALNRLKTSGLVDRTCGVGDGKDGYRLTRFGAEFLAACIRAQRTKD